MTIKYPKLQDRSWLVNQIKTKSFRKIAMDVGCSYSAVNSAIVAHDIDVQEVRGDSNVRKVSDSLEQMMLPKKEQIISAYSSGSPVSAIADEFSVSKAAVWKVFRKWGVDTSHPVFGPDKNALDRYKDEIAYSYTEELASVRSIAVKYNVSYKTARESLLRWGILRRGRVSLNPGLRDKNSLRNMYEIRKMSAFEIAVAIGSTPGSVNSALRWAGIPLRSISEAKHLSNRRKVAEKSHRWRGGRKVTQKGYVYMYAPNHPFAVDHGRYVMEHRLVMEKHIGRYLDPKEVVNHLNGNKQDNRIENLELVSDRGTHTKNHFHDSFRARELEKALREIDPEHPLLKKKHR